MDEHIWQDRIIKQVIERELAKMTDEVEEHVVESVDASLRDAIWDAQKSNCTSSYSEIEIPRYCTTDERVKLIQRVLSRVIFTYGLSILAVGRRHKCKDLLDLSACNSDLGIHGSFYLEDADSHVEILMSGAELILSGITESNRQWEYDDEFKQSLKSFNHDFWRQD